MTNVELFIANKKYSSWSMRPWIAMKVKEVEFKENLSRFDLNTWHSHFWEFSPTKKVPVLIHAGQTIWDSLAILEYLSELFPERLFWPHDRSARAHARSISCEMHSGFNAFRSECPMNMARKPSKISLSDQAWMDYKRIEKIWTECLSKYNGPFLFGEFSIADAMFAPVINRIDVYSIPQSKSVRTYSKAIKSLEAWQLWESQALAEPWICENVEM